jgi:hypothetical protein
VVRNLHVARKVFVPVIYPHLKVRYSLLSRTDPSLNDIALRDRYFPSDRARHAVHALRKDLRIHNNIYLEYSVYYLSFVLYFKL